MNGDYPANAKDFKKKKCSEKDRNTGDTMVHIEFVLEMDGSETMF